MMVLKSIRSQQDADGFFTLFAAMFEAGGVQLMVAVPAADLLSYSRFQVHVLKAVGRLYLNTECEGRAEPHADAIWKATVEFLLFKAMKDKASASAN